MEVPVKVQFSRTTALAAFAGLADLFLAVAVVVAMFLPAVLPDYEPNGAALGTIGVIAGCITTVCGIGAGGMAYRDGKSGGLTSSQGAAVLAHRQMSDAP